MDFTNISHFAKISLQKPEGIRLLNLLIKHGWKVVDANLNYSLICCTNEVYLEHGILKTKEELLIKK